MGKLLDKVAIMALLAGALYLFFMSAFHSIPLAAAAAFVAMALLKKLSGLVPRDGIRKKRGARRQAADTLEEWAFLSPDEAKENVKKLLARAYPGQTETLSLTLLSRHPSGGAVTVDDVTAEWKRHRGNERAVIVAFSRADEKAYALANALKTPQVRLIDGSQLTGLLVKFPQERPSAPAAVKRGGRMKAMLRAAGRARAGRCIASGAAMCVIYFFSGMTTYLVAGAFLLLIAGVSLKKRRSPTALFTE